jgi:hypothetical protein
MNITIEKISDEKFEITIKDGEIIIFNDVRYHNYMEEIVMDSEKINDTMQQLSSLFGELTVVQNDFNP